MTDYHTLDENPLIDRLTPGQDGATNRSVDQDARGLLQQLQIHQAELEAQNHELRASQLALEASRDQYADLYDFAPVGYLSLDRSGTVREINLTGASLLGKERASVLNTSLSRYLADGQRDSLRRHIRSAFDSGRREVCDIGFTSAHSGPRIYKLESLLPSGEAAACLRVSMTDVTELREAEDLRRQKASEAAALHTRDRFTAALEQVANAATGTFDPDEMLRRVTDVVRGLFQSDRAWLMYPCDPGSDSVKIKTESNSPAYPGALAQGGGGVITVGPQQQNFMRRALLSDAPVADYPGPSGMMDNRRYHIESRLIMAIRPQSGAPWLFGLHQCDRQRIWSDEEQVLFKLIGERLTEALDVTNLRRALQLSERRLSLALEGANDAIWDWNVEEGSCYVSPRWRTLVADADADADAQSSMLSNPRPAAIHPSDAPVFEQAIEQLLRGEIERLRVECRVRGDDGKEYWILVRGKPVECAASGAVRRVVGTYVDISARKHDEMQLRESQARLQKAQEMARMGCWEYDLKTKQAEWSAGFKHIFGMEPDVRSDPQSMQRHLHPDDREKFVQAMDDAMADRRPYKLTCRVILPGGQTRYLHSKAETFRDEQGRPVRLVGIAQDITAYKMQEERLSSLLEENRRLTQTCLKIQEHERRELARDLHDELGQYLTAVELGANYVNDRVRKLDIKLTEATADIMRASREALDSMRALTRRLRPRMLDCLSVEDTFRDTLRSWHGRFADFDYTFQTEGELDDLPEDIRVALYRILQEGLTNVAKHSQARSVSVRLDRRDDTITLVIEDDGKGITEDTTSTGVGLLGMQERAHALGGQLSLERAAGGGARIVATLPYPQA